MHTHHHWIEELRHPNTAEGPYSPPNHFPFFTPEATPSLNLQFIGTVSVFTLIREYNVY